MRKCLIEARSVEGNSLVNSFSLTSLIASAVTRHILPSGPFLVFDKICRVVRHLTASSFIFSCDLL